MKYISSILVLILIIILFCGCNEQTPTDKDLQDGKCNSCGGNWYFTEAVSFLNRVNYYYTCDNCGRDIYTPTWFENLKR